MLKLTHEEFIKRASEANPHLDFSNSKYINTTTKVKVVCPQHGEFLYVPKTFFKYKKCPECERIDREKAFIEKAKKVHNNKYIYSNIGYININDPVTITCPEHGKFKLRPSDHLKGWGCDKCSQKHKPTTQEWIEKALPVYDYKYDYSKVEYKDNKTPVTVICPLHGEFYPIPNNHIKGCSGCPKCRNELNSIKYRKTTEQFISDAKKVHGNLYDYSKTNYINKSTRVCIICPEHGEFWQAPAVHLIGCGCQQCVFKGQSKLYQILKDNFDEKIEYEYGPDWLTPLRFDIYFPEYNIAVEYDGILHFIPIDYFGGQINFQRVKLKDNLKNEKCLENNCILFRIKYDYSQEDLDNLINSIKTTINTLNNYKVL